MVQSMFECFEEQLTSVEMERDQRRSGVQQTEGQGSLRVKEALISWCACRP